MTLTDAAASRSATPCTGTWIAYADGSALNNPGPGGWAALLIAPDGRRTTIVGSSDYATNNVMELTAAIEALQALPLGASASIRSDSQYVVKGVNEWRPGWIKRGWRNSKGEPVANAGLWKTCSVSMTSALGFAPSGCGATPTMRTMAWWMGSPRLRPRRSEPEVSRSATRSLRRSSLRFRKWFPEPARS